MTTQYLLAIDQGTSSSRTVIYDGRANVVASAQQEFRQIYPQPGWVEHDPEEIWSSVRQVTREALVEAGITIAELSRVLAAQGQCLPIDAPFAVPNTPAAVGTIAGQAVCGDAFRLFLSNATVLTITP